MYILDLIAEGVVNHRAPKLKECTLMDADPCVEKASAQVFAEK